MRPTDYYFYTCSAINIHTSVSKAVIAAVGAVSPPPPPPIPPTASLSLSDSLSLSPSSRSKPSQSRQMVAHRWVRFCSEVSAFEQAAFSRHCRQVLAHEGHVG